MDELLRITSHHHAPPPPLPEHPGRYVGYFGNAYGEQLVFIHDHHQPDATLYLGDRGWEPIPVHDAPGVPDVGELILTREERAFVYACWLASASGRGQRQRPAA